MLEATVEYMRKNFPIAYNEFIARAVRNNATDLVPTAPSDLDAAPKQPFSIPENVNTLDQLFTAYKKDKKK